MLSEKQWNVIHFTIIQALEFNGKEYFESETKIIANQYGLNHKLLFFRNVVC